MTMHYLAFRARTLSKTHNVRVAAAYLRTCGVPLDKALVILTKTA